MARHRISRRFKDWAQLILGFALPALIVFALVLIVHRRSSRERIDASAALYSAITNAVVSKASLQMDFRIAPFVQLQYRKTEDRVTYVGWYENGPTLARTWFRVGLIDAGPPVHLSEVEFFPEQPPSGF